MMPQDTLAWVGSILLPALQPGHYGRLEIKIQDGQIVHVSESRDYKPPQKRIDKALKT